VRRQHRNTPVLVIEVVPAEEALAMSFGSAHVGESSRGIGPILQCFELRL
jgi:hypothetical protein